jgi:hypothetical protein
MHSEGNKYCFLQHISLEIFLLLAFHLRHWHLLLDYNTGQESTNEIWDTERQPWQKIRTRDKILKFVTFLSLSFSNFICTFLPRRLQRVTNLILLDYTWSLVYIFNSNKKINFKIFHFLYYSNYAIHWCKILLSLTIFLLFFCWFSQD